MAINAEAEAEAENRRGWWIENHNGLENAFDAMAKERDEYRQRAHRAEGVLEQLRRDIYGAVQRSGFKPDERKMDA